jgi:hypothetical protein
MGGDRIKEATTDKLHRDFGDLQFKLRNALRIFPCISLQSQFPLRRWSTSTRCPSRRPLAICVWWRKERRRQLTVLRKSTCSSRRRSGWLASKPIEAIRAIPVAAAGAMEAIVVGDHNLIPTKKACTVQKLMTPVGPVASWATRPKSSSPKGQRRQLKPT